MHPPTPLTRIGLFVDAMLPDFLLSPCRVGACTQDILHLLDTSEQNLPSNEPSDALMARRAGQATLVSPELVEVLHRLHSEGEVHLDRFLDLHLIKPNHRRELLEKGAVEVTRVKTEGENRALMAFSIDVDKVHLGLATIASNRVISWGMDVPAFKIECCIVVSETGVRCPVSVVGECESGTIAPVEKVAGYRASIVEGWDVIE